MQRLRTTAATDRSVVHSATLIDLTDTHDIILSRNLLASPARGRSDLGAATGDTAVAAQGSDWIDAGPAFATSNGAYPVGPVSSSHPSL
ncbi:MAG: hypothetical protein R2867_14160 [Caldilineaceae bacterium]